MAGVLRVLGSPSISASQEGPLAQPLPPEPWPARCLATASGCEAEEQAGRGGEPKKERKKARASLQLSRWAKARRARVGLLGDRQKSSEDAEAAGERGVARLKLEDDVKDEEEKAAPFKESVIYMVSDGTGWTAQESVHAALGQFDHCLVDRGCPVITHLFSEVNDFERLLEIIRNAGEERAMLLYTLADPSMAETAKKACELMCVPHVDILGPITEAISAHMGVSPSGLPRGAPGRKTNLSKLYFKRIEAVEFTIKQDDGALPKNLHKADIVLVGVSRTSKTPLSTYMAQKGYKVANVPLVVGIDPPKELFEIDQRKIYALTINPIYLQSIRLARYMNLGVAPTSSYSEMDHIKEELEYSSRLFIQNPQWPVIEITGKAIEETAAVILRMYHDRENKYDLACISRRY